MKTIKIDLMALIIIPLSLYLGFTGLVSWWVILLIALTQCEVKLTLIRGYS